MQVSSRYTLVTLFQAVLGGVIAVTILLLYRLAPQSLESGSLTIAIAGLGLVAVAYYLSIYQILKKRHDKLSGVIISLISATNIGLVIAATGGIDSPYYALWILALLVAGIFGGLAIILVLIATTAVYAYQLYFHIGDAAYFVTHLGQLGITLCAAVIAEWIHRTLGRSTQQHEKVAALSGQLSQEALKSNVLMNSVGEGVLVISENHQIQLFNPAAVRMTGWDEKSAQNLDYRLVLNLHDTDGNKINGDIDPFAEVWHSGKSMVHNELTMQTKGGHSVAISLLLSPIFDDSHKVVGGIALFRDISNDKEIERQRNEFISTASHEMRTPVAAIEGYLSLAMNPAVSTVDDRAKSYLEKAHASTQHLGALFRDLLSVTKMEDSSRQDKQEIFDLSQLANEAVADMQFTAQKKGLEVQFSSADQIVRAEKTVMPVYAVKGNPQRVREVITNLMENAIKFTTGGVINVTIGGTTDTVTVSVNDTGIGIAAEDIPHLFQKFYRIDSTATRTIGGTGLGLYLCRSIIERIGGRIWVESKLGEGSSFKFSLPRQASEKIMAPDALPAVVPAMPALATAPARSATPPPAAPSPPTTPSHLPTPSPVFSQVPIPTSTTASPAKNPPPAKMPSITDISKPKAAAAV
ncbi:MAG TPA: ATP-binding protein [Candidatus Polarisedimenticolaceae bacterium]|nr:ATP-binding protein [Candidatus Polarisedimenticolaceae bacterium]